MTATVKTTIGAKTFELRADTDGLDRVEHALNTSFVIAFARLGSSMRIADARKMFAALANASEDDVKAATAAPSDYIAACKAMQEAVKAAMPEAFANAGEGQEGAGDEAAENPTVTL